MFEDENLRVRPREDDRRGRSVLEQMVHQSLSEQLWFEKILGIAVPGNPLPESETRLAFAQRYADLAARRLTALEAKDEAWWTETVDFFGVPRLRAWVLTRRIAHTAHHRGQQTAMLRMLGHALYSTYGPTADTGGLMQDRAPTVYPYADTAALLREEAAGGKKAPLPGVPERPVTERPGARLPNP